MVAHLFIKFCMVLNPTLCQELEAAPIDHAMSLPECLRGAMMGNQSEFDYQGARWQIKGATCRQVPSDAEKLAQHLKSKISP